jgi:hydroxymethylpyrimidine pyrophosphatase-like HAD family hydrolase
VVALALDGSLAGADDADTDPEWRGTIGLPVAVANALARGRAAAATVIGHHGNDGVAEFLEELFELTTHHR